MSPALYVFVKCR